MAAVLGLIAVVLGGPELAVPAIALVALVYWGHALFSAFAGDEVQHAELALVIVVNSVVVLVVQALVFAASIEAF
ncbi:MAG TPA: hypothetical protein VFZ75_08085 [Actinomycetota bacterium]|nr:hypothetical protein [Actinomycetota bacterium]